MRREEGTVIRRIRRVIEFLKAHPEWNVSASFVLMLAELGDVLKCLTGLVQEQDVMQRLTRGETDRQRVLRDTLWTKHMLPIAGVAREAFGIPGVAVELRMPRKTADNDRVLKAARAMADAAEQNKDAFVRHGLPDNFVDALRGSAQVLADALDTRVQNNRRRGEATKEIRKQATRGRRVIRLIHHVIKPQLRDDAKLLAAWEVAKAPSDPGGVRSAAPAQQPDIAKVA